MSSLNKFSAKVSTIRHSRYLGVPTLIAMGTNITVGIGIYLLIGSILQSMGYQTPMTYLLILLFFLPIILTLAERTPIIQDTGGIYDLTQARENVRRGFLNGWMLMGGLLGLGALLAVGTAEYFNSFLAQLFTSSESVELLTTIFVLLVALNQYLGTHAEWRKRRLLVFGSIVFLLTLLALALVRPPSGLEGYVWLPAGNEIDTIPYFAIGLWGIYFILERSDQLRSGRGNVISSLLAPLVILAVLGVLSAIVLLRFPLLIGSSKMPLLVLAQTFQPIFALVLVVIVGAMLLTGLNQVFTSIFLLAHEMTDDGLLPPTLMRVTGKRDVPERLLLIVILMILVTAVFFRTDVVATIASACLLTALVVVHSQDITKKEPKLPEDRKLKLPLHPLFPIMVVIICVTLVVIQPLEDLLWPALWLLVGVIFYLLYARTAAIAKVQEDVVVAEEKTASVKASYRVLVCVSREETAVSLIRAGADVTRARQGDLLVLRVLDAPEQTPDKQELAHTQLLELEAQIAQAQLVGLAVNPLVRIAPSVAAGILATAWEENVNAILLGWPRPHDVPPSLEQESTIEYVIRRGSQEVLVLHGELPEAIYNVLVPMISDAHEVTALRLGQSLKQTTDDTVMAVQPVHERLTTEVESAFSEELYKQIDELEDTHDISGQVLQVVNIKDSLVRASEQYDLLIMGMSDEGFLATTTFSGVPVEIAESAVSPTILVKSAERRKSFLLRRAWEELTDWLPAVDKSQQAAVYLGMRRDAKATIDYYVLIFLATIIAYFGLLQNSGAVIIGAMLIAPLMSPILAMAQSIVQGNVRLLRQAANTTFEGILVAVGTAVVFTFGLVALDFPVTATSEILSRTQPNILDLTVALASGAAAAYAVSRKEVASALPGVAIAAALVPPLAVVGYGIGSIQFDYAAGALLLFTTNLAAIILAGSITFLSLGFRPPTRAERGEQTRYGLKIALVAMLVISVPLLVTTVVSNRQTSTAANIEEIIVNHWLPSQARIENIRVDRERLDYVADFDVYDFTGTIDTNDIITLQREIEKAVNATVILKSVILEGQLDVVDGATQPIPTPTHTPTYTPTLTSTVVFTPMPEGTPTDTPEP
jgi:uncharacterized hydrophobic protein (TIGR00271 family)